MNAIRTGTLLCFTLTIALTTSAEASVSSLDDPSYDAYRCVVLGQGSACHPNAGASLWHEARLGPYARYLASVDGMDVNAALAAGTAIGEVPRSSLAVTAVTASERAAPGPYAQYLITVDGLSRSDALAAARRIGELPASPRGSSAGQRSAASAALR